MALVSSISKVSLNVAFCMPSTKLKFPLPVGPLRRIPCSASNLCHCAKLLRAPQLEQLPLTRIGSTPLLSDPPLSPPPCFRTSAQLSRRSRRPLFSSVSSCTASPPWLASRGPQAAHPKRLSSSTMPQPSRIFSGVSLFICVNRLPCVGPHSHVRIFAYYLPLV